MPSQQKAERSKRGRHESPERPLLPALETGRIAARFRNMLLVQHQPGLRSLWGLLLVFVTAASL